MVMSTSDTTPFFVGGDDGGDEGGDECVGHGDDSFGGDGKGGEGGEDDVEGDCTGKAAKDGSGGSGGVMMAMVSGMGERAETVMI